MPIGGGLPYVLELQIGKVLDVLQINEPKHNDSRDRDHAGWTYGDYINSPHKVVGSIPNSRNLAKARSVLAELDHAPVGLDSVPVEFVRFP